MASKKTASKAQQAPKGKYHIDGLKILQTLVDDYGDRDPTNRAEGLRSFLDQVELAGIAHIPHSHELWRKTIRRGAVLFNLSEYSEVEKALVALLAGEKAARAKRKAKQAGGATTNEVEAHAARVADRRDGKPASTEDTAVEDKGAGAAGEGQRPGTWKSGFGGEVAAGETRDVTHSAEKRGGIVA